MIRTIEGWPISLAKMLSVAACPDGVKTTMAVVSESRTALSRASTNSSRGLMQLSHGKPSAALLSWRYGISSMRIMRSHSCGVFVCESQVGNSEP